MPVVFVGLGLAIGVAALFLLYLSWQKQLNDENQQIKRLQAQKTDLEQIKVQVEAFEKQKEILQQRVGTIEQLQKDRKSGEELLDEVASTVARTENLWLTSMTRKGSTLAIDGSSASINAVANFITALKRSGYFDKVEIQESKQDDKGGAVQTFLFKISADILATPAGQPAQAKPANAPGTPAAAAAKKG
jgi:Tfp pilus assembly protein PilN